jgi:WD40 repeat protein
MKILPDKLNFALPLFITTLAFTLLLLAGCGSASPAPPDPADEAAGTGLHTPSLTPSPAATLTSTATPAPSLTPVVSPSATFSPTVEPTLTPTPSPTPLSLPQPGEPLTQENASLLQELASWGEGTVESYQVLMDGQISQIFTPFNMRLAHSGTLESIAVFENVDLTALSPDKQFLAITFKGQSRLEIWHLPSGSLAAALEHTIEAPRYPPPNFSPTYYFSVSALAFSQDGGFLAAGFGNSEIVIWRTDTWEQAAVLVSNISRVPGKLVFSRDGQYLVSTEINRLVFWKMDDYSIKGYLSNAGSIGNDPFSDDSTYLLSSDGPKVLIWNVKELSLVRSFAGGAKYIRSVLFSPNGEYIIVDGFMPDGYQVRRFRDGLRLDPGKEAAALEEWGFSERPPGRLPDIDLMLRAQGGYYPPFHGMALINDETGLLTWGMENTQLVWLKLPEELFSHVELGSQAMNSAVLSPDESTLAVCLQNQDLALVELSTKTVRTLPGCRSSGLLAFLPDGRLLWSNGTLVDVVNPADGTVSNSLRGHSAEVNSLYVHPDGIYILSGTKKMAAYAEVILWKTSPSFARVTTYRIPDLTPGRVINVDVLAISPDGVQMANSRFQGGVETTHLTGEYPLWLSRVGTIWAMAYSPDGRLLALGDRFGQLYLVETEHGKILYPLTEPVNKVQDIDEYTTLIQQAVRAVVFPSNGEGFYSLGDDGIVRLWGVP